MHRASISHATMTMCSHPAHHHAQTHKRCRRLTLASLPEGVAAITVSTIRLCSLLKVELTCCMSPCCGCACRGEYCTVSSDGTIRGWDSASHAQLFELAAPGEVILCCAYHPDRHELACGFDQGRVRVFDIAETALLQEHKQHRQAVLQIVYLPSGKLLFSLGEPSA